MTCPPTQSNFSIRLADIVFGNSWGPVAVAFSTTGSALDSDLASVTMVFKDSAGNVGLSLANGTCTGITPAPDSANTTEGVATSGARIFDGDGKDWEGNTLDEITYLRGLLVQGNQGLCQLTIGEDLFAGTVTGSNTLFTWPQTTASPPVLTCTAALSLADITLTVIGAI